jgi:hypothetical protein
VRNARIEGQRLAGSVRRDDRDEDWARIDEDLQAMAEDSEYQAEAIALATEWALASWEALQLAESSDQEAE